MKKDDKKNKKKYDKEEVPLKHFGFNNLSELVKTVSNEDKNISFIRFITADMLGENECSFTVPRDTLIDNEETLKKGFDALSLYPERINESDTPRITQSRPCMQSILSICNDDIGRIERDRRKVR